MEAPTDTHACRAIQKALSFKDMSVFSALLPTPSSVLSPHGRPRVTVLMPVYNGAAFLRPAIASILNQTFAAPPLPLPR